MNALPGLLAISSLEEELNELKYFKDYLKHKGKLEWAKDLAKSIVNLLPEIEKIIDNSKEETLIVNYAIDDQEKKVFIVFEKNSKTICFSSKFKRIDTNGFDRNKDGSLKLVKVLNSALSGFRKYLEILLSYDEDTWLNDYME